MSTKSESKYFRQKKASNIERLQEILIKHKILKNPESLSDMASRCKFDNDKKPLWRYYGSRLDFGEIEDDIVLKHIIPSSVPDMLITLYLDIDIEGHCIIKNNYTSDPLCKLALDIELHANDSGGNYYFCCFHLDRHIGDQNSEISHPRYHFQFGGNKVKDRMKEHALNFGSSLFIEPPRIAYAPLGLVLSIDFVLSNFYPTKRKKLIKMPEYTNLVRHYQEHLWRPYLNALAVKWSKGNINSDWQSCDVWPQLID